MSVTERYQLDYFSIVIIIVTVLILVFLIIAAIYFYNLMNLKPPSKGESSFLFWTSIILAVIIFAVHVYAIWRLFTYKVPVYQETVEIKQISQPNKQIIIKEVTETSKQGPEIIQPKPVTIGNIPLTTKYQNLTPMQDENMIL